MRITEHPILPLSRGRRVTFSFEGRTLEGYEGEPIAAALHAAGVQVLHYSPVLHRPRGFFCANGRCSSCFMVVNGRANVRACVEPLVLGMTVQVQHGRQRLGGAPG